MRSLTDVPLEQRRSAPAHQRRGVLISRPHEGGPEQHIDLIQCCHCQRIWPWVQGSGKLRGWCMRCSGFFCGPKCETCVHWQQLMANLGAGMTFEQAKRHNPIQASVPADVPKSGILLGKG